MGLGNSVQNFVPQITESLFTLLEPNGTAPLQALLSMAGSESTDDPKFNHFRDELPNRTLTVNGAVASTSTTSIVVDNDDDEAFVVAGTILQNQTTGEIMRATADANLATNTLTVERNIGGTSHQIADDAVLVIAGHADQEGGTSPTAISFDPTTDFNFTQIFKTAVQVSGTLQNTYLRTGDKEQEQLTKALKLHMGDIERAMFFGKRHEANGTTASPTRFTGGLLNQITNVTDGASFGATANTITEKEFDRLLIEQSSHLVHLKKSHSVVLELSLTSWKSERIGGNQHKSTMLMACHSQGTQHMLATCWYTCTQCSVRQG